MLKALGVLHRFSLGMRNRCRLPGHVVHASVAAKDTSIGHSLMGGARANHGQVSLRSADTHTRHGVVLRNGSTKRRLTTWVSDKCAVSRGDAVLSLKRPVLYLS